MGKEAQGLGQREEGQNDISYAWGLRDWELSARKRRRDPGPRELGLPLQDAWEVLGAREVWVEQVTPGPVICTFRCCPPSTQPLSLPPWGERISSPR